MAKFQFKETVINSYDEAFTARFGAGTGAANNVTSLEVGKFAKLTGDSLYNLTAAGDPIEAVVLSVESFTQDAYSIVSLIDEGLKEVTFDGLQATPGTGTVAIGDYVVTGTVVAKGTALTSGVPAKVTKATTQTGQYFAWRVESLGTAGTGAVGTVGIIRRINA
jgi:hypothetical protein